MRMLDLVLFVCLLSTVPALEFRAPVSTIFAKDVPNVDGWTPLPTAAALVPGRYRRDLLYRQVSSSFSPLTASGANCGYDNGNADAGLVCGGSGPYCAFEEKYSWFGCCQSLTNSVGSSSTSCGIPYISCWDSTYSDDCNANDGCTRWRPGPGLACNFNSDLPYCTVVVVTGVYGGSTLTLNNFGCGPTPAQYNLNQLGIYADAQTDSFIPSPISKGVLINPTWLLTVSVTTEVTMTSPTSQSFTSFHSRSEFTVRDTTVVATSQDTVASQDTISVSVVPTPSSSTLATTTSLSTHTTTLSAHTTTTVAHMTPSLVSTTTTLIKASSTQPSMMTSNPITLTSSSTPRRTAAILSTGTPDSSASHIIAIAGGSAGGVVAVLAGTGLGIYFYLKHKKEAYRKRVAQGPSYIEQLDDPHYQQSPMVGIR